MPIHVALQRMFCAHFMFATLVSNPSSVNFAYRHCIATWLMPNFFYFMLFLHWALTLCRMPIPCFFWRPSYSLVHVFGYLLMSIFMTCWDFCMLCWRRFRIAWFMLGRRRFSIVWAMFACTFSLLGRRRFCLSSGWHFCLFPKWSLRFSKHFSLLSLWRLFLRLGS